MMTDREDSLLICEIDARNNWGQSRNNWGQSKLKLTEIIINLL